MTLTLNKGKIFYIPKFNNKNYYLFIFALCSLFRRAFPYFIDSFEISGFDVTNFNKSCVFDMISNFTNDILTGFFKLYFYLRKRKKRLTGEQLIENFSRSNTGEEDDSLSKKRLVLAEQKQNEGALMRKKFMIIMGIIAVVDTIAQICLLVFSYIDTDGCALSFSKECGDKPKINEDDLIFLVAINIVCRYIFSRLLLTLYIYYHHFVSIIITLLSFVPLIILNIIALKNNEKSAHIIIYIFLNLAMNILYALEDVLNKVALNKLIIRPYEIMFYKSLFQIPLFFITFLSVVLVDKYNPPKNSISLGDYIKKNKSKLGWRLLYRFSFIFPNTFRTLSLISVTEVLTPNHLSILKSLEFCLLTPFSMTKDLINMKKSKKSVANPIYFYITELICCIFMLFASCIHNEIFVINRFNLSKSTDYYKGTKTDNEIDEEISTFQKITEEENRKEEERNSSQELLDLSDMTGSSDDNKYH